MKTATRVCGLKDCQKCGSDDAVIGKVIYPVSKRPEQFFVECNNCGFEGSYHDTAELAVESWNGDLD